jgi:hypothetical protein
MKSNCLLKPILLAMASSSVANAALIYRLGEDDSGASNGSALSSTTVDSGGGGDNLNLVGSGGTYTSTVPLGGSTLAGSFSGSQHYAATGLGFYSGLDLADFEFSADVRATGVSGFNIAMSLGHNDAGALFLYHVGDGGTWRLHSNGVGDLISGGTVTFNTWQNLKVVRNSGVISLFVDDVSVGSSGSFTSTGGLGDTFSIGAHTKNPGTFESEGRFIGQVDNVVIGAIPEPSSALLGLAGLGMVLRRRRA